MRKLTFLTAAMFVCFGVFSQQYDAQTLAKMRAEKEAAAAQQAKTKTKKQQKVDVSKGDILMHQGTETTCDATFYDTGGATADYGVNENFVLTFLPETAGAQIMITFTEFDIENNYEHLRVYNGTSISAPLLADLTGTALPPEPFLGENPDGALTFHFTSDGYVTKAGWKATVECFTPVPKNLAAVKLNTSPSATAGAPKTVPFIIKNQGSEDVTGSQYTVQLQDADNNVLASASGVDINSATQTSIDIIWTPTAEGTIDLKGVIIFAEDENQDNNATELVTFTVYPEGTYVAQIGSGTILPTMRIPFDFYWKNSFTQVIYTPAQLGIGGGVIEAIAYNYNFLSTNIGSKGVRIWIGETAQPDLSGALVDPNTLTLVYEGNLDFPGGIQELTINLQQPYIYTGGNLVIYTYREFDSGFYSSSDKFYATEFAGANCTRYTQTDTQFNPLAPAAGTLTNWVPNTTLYISTAGLGSVSGNVISEGAPLGGVTVKILDNPQVTATDASGNYAFPYLVAGMYNLEFSKFGFGTVVEEDITVVGDANTVVNTTISPIYQYMVSGTVTASDTGDPLENVVVKFTGYADYTSTTDAAGHYSMTGVWGGGNIYDVTAEIDGYQKYTGTVTVNTDHITDHNIVVEEIAYPAKKVVATLAEPNVDIVWNSPFGGPIGDPQWIHWDDGINDDAIGTGGAVEFMVAHRYTAAQLEDLEVVGMSITKIRFFPYEPSATYTVRIWTGGSAAAPGTLAYEQAVPSVVDHQWNEVVLNNPVEIPEGVELWYGVNINTPTGYPAGIDNSTTVNGFGNMMFFEGSWQTLMAIASIDGNWNLGAYVDNAKGVETKLSMIKAEQEMNAPKVNLANGKALAKGVSISRASDFGHITIAENNASRVMLNYSVYRLVKDQPQAEWTQLVAATNDTTFVDNTWATQPAGLYQYAVVVNYTNGVVSVPVLSNILAKAMEVEYTVNITTNGNDPATGAIVTLTNQDGDVAHAYQATAGETGATFPAVWRGVYDITVTKVGFEPYSANDVNINETGSHSVNLIEIIIAPFGLQIIQDGNNENFSWNNSTGFTDDIESYEDFIIANIGEYTLVDVDGHGTYSITNTTFGNQNYTGSYIVFNPSATTPPLATDQWNPHSGNKYLGCFAADGGANNDWIITPEITAAAGMEFSFWAKSVTDQYGLERFKVGVSTGGTAPADFTIISGATYIQAPITWTKYTYSLSSYAGQTVRLAIQCVSDDAFLFMVDDIALGMPKSDSKAFNGYTVYLDGAEKATGIMGNNYTFNNVTLGAHTAGVKAVYSSGSSSTESITFNHDAATYNVTFTVKRVSNGAPIVGANVVINGESLTTNTQGIASISLPGGTYDWVVTKPGFATQAGSAEVTDHLDIAVNMTGIEGQVALQNITLYPNPVANMLTIVRENTTNAMVEIYSNSGVIVNSFEMNEAVKEISVSDLNSGVYFIRVIENEATTVQRFIKK